MKRANRNSTEVSMDAAGETRQDGGRVFFPAASPTRIGLVFNWGDLLICRAISAVTGGPSHVALAFDGEVGGYPVYYEALLSEDVAGPKPLDRIYRWKLESARRRVEVIWLPAKPEQAARARLFAQTFVGSASYGAMQLFWMLAMIRWGWRVPRSIGKVVCSEYVVRCLYPDIWTQDNFDEVTPADVYEWAKRRAERSQTP